ncbi:MAG: DUF1403 family protein [Bosea sp.]|nr:DUF1403 family protein [Bosea sp. (in: a-proteobacteria)]MCP4738792.1 DUF1403 family protein [Bosea sp. (in: a-proteobacteria)]
MQRTESNTISALSSLAVPGWAIPRGVIESDVEAAFLAGAALNSLDNLVRAAPPWSGAWRQRLALKCAATAAGAGGRTEDERQIRDAWHLRSGGGDPGPAGNLLAAWRRLADRAPELSPDGIRSIVGLLGLRWTDELGELAATIADYGRSTRPAPLIAAAIMAEVQRISPDAELLGWWLADLAIAARMRWPVGVPMLGMQARGAAYRGPGGRGRIRPGGEGFERAVCVALAMASAEACRLAAEIAPRAAQLVAVAPKLRAKGAGEVVRLLLDNDAVSGTLQTASLTRWGARRLFDRLSELAAVRELSGRASFRLYGL